jgi:hypothetical protein
MLSGGVLRDGIEVTLLSALNSGAGVHTTDVDSIDLRGRVARLPLSTLNNGDGVRTVSGR